MKNKIVKCLYFGLFFAGCTTATAQVISQKIGDNPTIINPSAALEIESTTKGLLLPRVTTTQRAAIATPAAGLQVYDTTTNSIWYYNGTAWTNTNVATIPAWALTGNAGTDPATNFIGTTDAQPLVFRTNNSEKLRIANNGRVSIGGIINPESTLDIVVSSSTTIPPTSDSQIKGIRLYGELASSAYNGITFNSQGGGSSGLIFSRDDGWGTQVGFYTNSGTNQVGGAMTERMRIMDNGNVGIGTTTPVTIATGGVLAKLTVAGEDASINDITVGRGAGNDITSTVFGNGSLFNATSGTENSAFGQATLSVLTTGTANSSFGAYALDELTTGNNNSAFGRAALTNITTGDKNTSFGANTGLGITTGSANTIIGSNVVGLAANLSNNIIIADGDGNRRINVIDNGNVGIGTTAPTAILDVNNFFNSGVDKIGMKISHASTAGLDHAGLWIHSNHFGNFDRYHLRITNLNPAQENVETFNIDHMGQVYARNSLSIGTTSHTSNLEVNGSIGFRIATTTANIVLDTSHNTVRVDATASDITVTVPLAADATNRIYTIIKADSSAHKLLFSATIHGNGYTFTEANVAGTYRIQSNGTSWFLID